MNSGNNPTGSKVIAMYLPQFHEISENNEWWGQGFTEWTTVKNAEPLFEGHEQPKKPWKNNYYNLLEKSTMLQQNRLMKEYSVEGLCFYHYYFKEGRKILEKPAENLLKWKDIDMPFCFCWANESWARTWSNIGNKNSWSHKFEKSQGQGSDILLEQKYGREYEWRKHFEYLLPFFQDERYIKKDGLPIFLFYKPEEIGCLCQMTDYWVNIAKEYNIPGVYFIGLNTVYKRKGLDAVLLNAPAMFWKPSIRGGSILPTWLNGIKTFEYDKIWDNILSAQPISGCKTYFGGFVNYDDSPRHNKNGTVLTGFSIEKFRNYLSELRKKNILSDNEFVFINAWNEWGEGMYLEPDVKYGFQYLEAIRDTGSIVAEKVLNFQEHIGKKEEDGLKRNENFLHNLNKHKRMMECLDTWMSLKEKGTNTAEYLKRYGYKRVAVYGMGILGKHLLHDFKQADVEVAYIIDQRVELHYPQLKVKSMDDPLDKVDAVIVTVIADFDEIYEVLKDKVTCPILSISEIVNEI